MFNNYFALLLQFPVKFGAKITLFPLLLTKITIFFELTSTAGINRLTMIRIGILASGSGTNADKIMDYFSTGSLARVALLMSDNPSASALERASRKGIPTAVFSRTEFAEGAAPLDCLRRAGIDYVVLAGFLRLIHADIVRAYPGRIVNIHPALLPAYGGKGMYGDRVHRAVIEAGERESGITIHRVNERYDEGAVIAQFRVAVSPDDTPESLAAKIHALEHRHFPPVIEQEIKRSRNAGGDLIRSPQTIGDE